jgi:hypothetical protein
VDARTLLRTEIDADVSVGSCAAAGPPSRFYPTTLVEPTALVCSEPTTFLKPTALVCSEPTTFLNSTALVEPTALVCSEPTTFLNPITLIEPTALVCSEPTTFLNPTTLIEPTALVCSQPTAFLNPTTLLDVRPATLRALCTAGVRTALAGHFAPTRRTLRASAIGASRLN